MPPDYFFLAFIYCEGFFKYILSLVILIKTHLNMSSDEGKKIQVDDHGTILATSARKDFTIRS